MTDNAAIATLEDLFPELPRAGTRRYKVEVMLDRDEHDNAPDEDQATADLALVMLAARGLVTGWMSKQALLTMVLDAESAADAVEAGAVVVRALGGGRSAARVEVEPTGAGI